MKNVIKTMLVTAIATIMFTGCTMNTIKENVNSFIEENSTSVTNEEPVNSYEENISNNEEANSNNEENASINESKPENNSSEIKENASSTIIEEKPVSSSTNKAESSSTTKKEEKPVSSSTSSSSTNKPVSSSSNKPVENPVSSSSTNKPTSSSTTKIEEKPIHTHNFTEATCTNPATCISCGETKGTTVNHNYNNGSCIYCGKNDPNYVKCDKHNIDDPNHEWEITYTTTEPKWCEEMHDITDYGYDLTLAAKFLGVNQGKARRIFLDNMEAIGVIGDSGNGTMTVKVWGTETFETRKCKNCGHTIGAGNIGKITPMGEWQFLNGKNPRITNPSLDFNTIFYDPYNVPQKVIDNINLMWEIV